MLSSLSYNPVICSAAKSFAFIPLHPFTINQQPSIPLTPRLKPIAARLAILATLLPIALLAQQPAPRTVILLDPAHGGPDTGARFTSQLFEKEITLSFATSLRSSLSASGFTVIATRDSDPTVLFTTDQRAEIANHARPTACLILHATSSGHGIHIITSALTPPTETGDISDADKPHALIPWQTAQAAYIPQSLRLANELGLALLHSKLPVILTQTSIPPLDNLLCPAVAIEIAPLTAEGSDPTPAADAAYQQRITQAIIIALNSWRTHNAPAAGAPR
jgi:N-acetylmuramoyl-L-alanine amidase